MTKEEIQELEEEIPELKQLNGPSPFDQKKVKAIIEANGEEINAEDIENLMKIT